MEYLGTWPNEGTFVRVAHSSSAREIRAWRIPAFWTREVVSRRVAAAMDVHVLLAHRRYAALARSELGRRSIARLRIWYHRSTSICGRAVAPPFSEPRLHCHGL